MTTEQIKVDQSVEDFSDELQLAIRLTPSQNILELCTNLMLELQAKLEQRFKALMYMYQDGEMLLDIWVEFIEIQLSLMRKMLIVLDTVANLFHVAGDLPKFVITIGSIQALGSFVESVEQSVFATQNEVGKGLTVKLIPLENQQPPIGFIQL